MFCPNCGNQVPDGAAFCGACGQKIVQPPGQRGSVQPEEQKKDAVQRQENAQQPRQETAPSQKQGASRKKIIIAVVAIAAVIIIAAVVVFLLMGSSKKDQWQEQYDLGEQYLTEENYEQAVVAFTAAIEIDDQETDAYMGRAEAYTALGEEDDIDAALSDYDTVITLEATKTQAYIKAADIYVTYLSEYDSAQEILEKGLEANPDDEELTETLEEVEELIEEEALKGRYQAYYEKLTELQETYGSAELVSALQDTFSYLTGLCFAQLVDFDGNGEEELVAAYYDSEQADSGVMSAYTIEVWSCDDGTLSLLHTQDSYSGSDYETECFLAEAGDISYIISGYSGGDGYLMEYYTLSDGSMVLTESLDVYASTAGYLVNGEEMTDEAFTAAENEWMGQLTDESVYYFFVDTMVYGQGCLEDTMEELEETLAELTELLQIEAAEEEEEAADIDWAQAYLDYLADAVEADVGYSDRMGLSIGDSSSTYDGIGLIYVNDDEIPELVLLGSSEAVGCLVLTVSAAGAVDVLQTNRLYFYYIEKGNILDNSEGIMGMYWDTIYSIDEDGTWQMTASGTYEAVDEDYDNLEYYWNGVSVTEEEYYDYVESYIDKDTALNNGQTKYDGDTEYYTLETIRDYLEGIAG